MRDRFIVGENKREPFFEGWYFTHRRDDSVLAVIPGTVSGADGAKDAFVQVIWNEGSRYVRYPFDVYHADREARMIMVGNSVFSPDGVMLDIQDGDFAVTGQLEYRPQRRLKRTLYAPDMMGPYGILPFMECYHDVVSLRHYVTGKLDFNGSGIVYDRDAGYIEKDWGRSFPREWLWLHCNDFIADREATLMLAIARVPYMGRSFAGVLCLLDYGGNQVRLATYYGARCTALTVLDDSVRVSIRQGAYLLQTVVGVNAGRRLYAPCDGVMSRDMAESLTCSLNTVLWRGDRLLWADTGRSAAFECVGDVQGIADNTDAFGGI